MRPSGTEKIGGGRRFENKLDFIGDKGEYPELSLPSGAIPWATRLLKLLCCHWEISDPRKISGTLTIHIGSSG